MVTPIKSDYTSIQESLELLYHISREIASTLDLTIVLQRVLALSMRTIGAVSGSIIVVNDECEPVESTIIYEDTILDHSTDHISSLLKSGLAGWVVTNRQPALVLNTKRDERWVSRATSSDNGEKAKSSISVPFIARDQLVGVITLSHPVPLFFTDEHLALVQAIADQAAIAVVNARLYETSQQQAFSMGALAKSAASISSTLRLDDVLQRILDQISQALNVAAVSLALLDEDKDSLVYYATTANAEKILGREVAVGQGIVGWVAQHNEAIVVPDVSADPRFFEHFDKSTGFDTRAIACGPIISDGELIGVLQALNPLDGSFGPDALTVLDGIGSLAGTAIRHAQLFEDLQAAHKRYRDLYNSSIDAILITDMRGHIIEVNNQTFDFTGFSREQLQLKHIDDVHEIDREAIGESLEQISPEETFSYESELETSTELLVPISLPYINNGF